MSKKALLALLLIALSCQCLAADDTGTVQGRREAQRSMHYICTHQDEMKVIDDVYEFHRNANLALMLLSGDRDDAIAEIRAQLITSAQTLAVLRKGVTCQDPKDTRGLEKARTHIGRALSRLAAINQVTPIPGLGDDKDVQDILQQAIADDPGHYQRVLELTRKQAQRYQRRAQQAVPAKP